MRELLVIAGGILFVSSSAAYVFVKATMRPQLDDLEPYHEFEDRNPRLARYNRYSRLSIAGAVLGALLLFLGTS